MTRTRDIEQQAAAWIARKDGDAWSAECQSALDAWLAESTLNRVAFLRLQSVWSRADRLQALKTQPAPTTAQPKTTRSLSWIHHWVPRLAAAVIAMAMVVVWAPWVRGELLTTELGARKTVPLADGSTLTLNTATRVRTEVTAEQRRVWLDQGEVYFDIAHDAEHPFEVRAGAQKVVVLGTRFTVRRVGDELRVSVVEGRVAVLPANTAGVVLKAGEAAVSNDRAPVVTQQTLRQTNAALGWLDGRLVFDRVSLAEAAAQFNRYNRKQLVVMDAKAGQLLIGGTFGATNVEAFSRLLQSSFGLRIEERGDAIQIRSVPTSGSTSSGSTSSGSTSSGSTSSG